ncbi:DUF4330 family protein [Patescibacteria group bacterium]
MHKQIKKLLQFLSKLKKIDWIVIIIFTIGTVLLVISSLKKNRWITITIKVQITPASVSYYGETPPYWLANQIKPGDVQYDSLGQQNLKVISVKSWGFTTPETWVTASVKAKYLKNQEKYVFMYQPLEIGRPINVTINGTSIRGLVTTVEGFSDERPTYDILVKARLHDDYSPYSTYTRGVNPWMADALKIGQIMKNSNGTKVAEIIDKEESDAERIVTTSSGNIILDKDPLKKDVILTVKLKVIKQNNTYIYLEDKPIKVGFSFPIYLEHVFVTPTVIEILPS